MTTKPSIHIVNLGCSKNQVDAERIYGDFVSAGFRTATSPAEASIVVVNTCGFIEAAKEESINEILARLSERPAGQKIVVSGCLSQRYLADLKKELPEVDLFCGTYRPGELLDLVRESTWAPGPCAAGSPGSSRVLTTPSHYAYVKVSEGCDRVCSFCAIPGIRGKHVSRTASEIVSEINTLSGQGVKEAILIAQDLTYWGRELGPGHSLSGLLRQILSETDVPWIRLTYAYPQFLDDSLLELLATEPRLCKYLDMPLQHATQRMLDIMRRGHTSGDLRALVKRLRQVPDLSLRTTFLVGHPGETEADFQELMEFADEVRFDRLGVFPYSLEEGTHAASLPDPVPAETAQERMETLMDRQAEISLERNEALVGQELTVLVDTLAEGQSWRFDARTQADAPEVDNSVQIVDGDAEPGAFARVRIVGATEYDLEAVVLDG